MKKYKYRAESYIDYLTHLRDLARIEVRDAEVVMQELEMRIQESEKQMSESLTRNSQFSTEHDDIQWIQDNNKFLRSLRHNNLILKQELDDAGEVHSQKQMKLMELQRKLKSVEKHKDKKEKDYNSKLKKKEQKNSDDMNAIRMGRSSARSVS